MCLGLTSNTPAPNGNGTLAITETYNAVGRLTQTTTNPAYYNSGISTLITSAHYNALGEITQQALGNGLTENWTYDDRGREASYSLTNGSTSLYSYSLSYFPNGNVMSSNDTINGDWVFGYDDLNRMTSATVTGQEHSPNATFAYLYDRFGNRWDQNVTSGSGPTSSLAFDANNHITASGVTYDAAGDVTYDGTNTYTYDAEGRISGDPSLNTQELYDAEGRRDIIISPSLQYPDYYVYDLQDHPLGIWNPAYAYFRGEYYASGHHLATFSNLLIFNHPDWLGTEHYRTEPNGALYGSCQNDPFGDNMWCSEAQGDLSPVHFAGKERDYSGTANPDGLDYFGARYYSSNMARFMSADPLSSAGGDTGDPSNPQSWNAYSYVRNSPISNVDPDGLDCITPQGWNSDGSLTVQIIRGEDCTPGQGGVFVNGTVDVSTLSLTQSSNGYALSYDYSLYDSGPQMSSILGNFGVDPNLGTSDFAALGESWQMSSTALNDINTAFDAFFGFVAPETAIEAAPEALSMGTGARVIGKMQDLEAFGALRPGESPLDLPNQGSPKANWAQNASKLREAMSEGKPIRDVSAGRSKATGFLRAERNLLENHGWKLRGDWWYPPGK